MSNKKLPFISSVNLAQIDGRTVVPTAIYYGSDKRPHIGFDARERCEAPEQLLEDFKIELGQHDPDAVTRRTANSPFAPRTTVVGIAQDFFRELLSKVNGWLERQGRPLPKSILIAEPLALSGINMADENWLSNYRRAIRRVLQGRFDQIDFLPEPFAVFQYYRYGLRHPVISEQRKHIALVLDFGGGTFDISVIETTKAGDVSQSGTNSRPLSAKSVQVGGFYINRLLAADLLMKAVDRTIRGDVRKSLEIADRIKTPDDLAEVAERQQVFYRHYRRLLHSVEIAKLSVCNSIANWNLAADLSGLAPFPISVPVNPYDPESRIGNINLDAGLLRQTFESGIWTAKLRDAVRKTIERASRELKGQDISVVLLSGGSSNIRWLAKLLERDVGKTDLPHAQILQLSENFQEIVAKGLATECARRFFTEGQGDFRAVTYNRLCLSLRPDGGEVEVRRARAMTPDLADAATDGLDAGVLLPSATSLRGLVGTPLLWKIRLNSPPRQVLEYFFMRSSFDPEDLEARHNIVDTRAVTPKNARFAAAIEVELTVRDDGTAIPRFIYGRSDRSDGVVAEGRPFHIDMTFASEEAGSATYLGFDFGTSASSCSFVDSADVQMIQERSRSSSWRELSELLSDLPYPVAAPLARFISEMDSERRQQKGRDAADSLLTLAAYIAYMDLCSSKAGGGLFKGFTQRSAGPLWGLIKTCLSGNQARLDFASPLSTLIKPENMEQIDSWIAGLNSGKHGRRQAVDWVGFLSLLANQVARVFETRRLGVFEGVVAKRFNAGSYAGIFRVLHGPSQTFVDVLDYSGKHPFSDEIVYLIDPPGGRALALSPLYFWGLERNPLEPATVDIYEYDHDGRGSFGYKTTQLSEGLTIGPAGEWAGIYEQLATMRSKDLPSTPIVGVSFMSHAS
ncbi:hypothetical protein QFZ88_005422 [Mesorhizobium sp. YL-MeA3-2017]|uniref:molecular chaperone n=1 Tax=Mesorhizobium sp. YL-MeA3-2017 TaxID=3042284 RepID=UPI0015C86800|nr:molecular chaperone [Mesorhizobium sp. YL-MeA3-2017]MDQ0333040.1 hypothetical protein [Mesorhizobium sp. YL-MeA3-2017]